MECVNTVDISLRIESKSMYVGRRINQACAGHAVTSLFDGQKKVVLTFDPTEIQPEM